MTTDDDRTIAQLRRRVDRLELIVLRVWCVAVAAVVVVGLLSPYATEIVDGDELGWSVLVTPFRMISSGADSGSPPEGIDIALLVGFIGLVLVLLALLGGLVVIGRAVAGDRTATILRILLALAGIGSVVVLALTALASQNAAPGYAGWILVGGVAAYATLLSDGGRTWWVNRAPDAQPRPTRR